MRNTWDSSVGRAEDSKSLCTSSNLVPSGIPGIAQLVEQGTENLRSPVRIWLLNSWDSSVGRAED